MQAKVKSCCAQGNVTRSQHEYTRFDCSYQIQAKVKSCCAQGNVTRSKHEYTRFDCSYQIQAKSNLVVLKAM